MKREVETSVETFVEREGGAPPGTPAPADHSRLPGPGVGEMGGEGGSREGAERRAACG